MLQLDAGKLVGYKGEVQLLDGRAYKRQPIQVVQLYGAVHMQYKAAQRRQCACGDEAVANDGWLAFSIVDVDIESVDEPSMALQPLQQRCQAVSKADFDLFEQRGVVAQRVQALVGQGRAAQPAGGGGGGGGDRAAGCEAQRA